MNENKQETEKDYLEGFRIDKKYLLNLAKSIFVASWVFLLLIVLTGLIKGYIKEGQMDAESPFFKHLNYKDFFWVLFVFFILLSCGIFTSEQRHAFITEQKIKENTENLERQHKQEFQKASEENQKKIRELTEKFEKELLTTKIELLLTQNKLRELKEKDEENKN